MYGSVTLSSPLPLSVDTMTDFSSEVTALSFTDGVQTVDVFDAGDTIEFETSDGQISEWDIVVKTGVTDDRISTQYSTPQGMDNFDQGSLGPGDFGLIAYDPGEWTSVSAPEPATSSAMFCTILAIGMVVAGIRMNRPAEACFHRDRGRSVVERPVAPLRRPVG